MNHQYHFTWDPATVTANREKHGVSFELVASLFQDPLAVSIHDDEHSSDNEERWITLDQADNGTLLVVVHTFEETGDDASEIRLISAPEATRVERRQYEDGAITTKRSEHDFPTANAASSSARMRSISV